MLLNYYPPTHVSCMVPVCFSLNVGTQPKFQWNIILKWLSMEEIRGFNAYTPVNTTAPHIGSSVIPSYVFGAW